jgi:hypothetical protein
MRKELVLERGERGFSVYLPVEHTAICQETTVNEILARIRETTLSWLSSGTRNWVEDGIPVPELVVWNKAPRGVFSKVIRALEQDGWTVAARHGNHVRLENRCNLGGLSA